MISFRCEMCNGTVKINPDRQTCTCEYCGRTSMLTPEMKAYVDGLAEEERKEAERMRQREAMERMKQEAMQRKEQKSAGCSSCLVFSIIFICILCAFCFFFSQYPLAGFIALVQAVLFFLGWLMKMHILKEKRKNLHYLLYAIGALLVVAFFFSMKVSNDIDKANYQSERNSRTYTWPKNTLSALLPTPTWGNHGYVYSNSISLSADFYQISLSDFEDYRQACIDMGFDTIDSEEDLYFSAYNDDNYYLALYYYNSLNELDLTLTAPDQFVNYSWPKNGVGSLLPEPASKLGKTLSNSSTRFSIRIGECSLEDFNSYVDECAEAGFSVDYNRDDLSYSAKDTSGNYLNIEYTEHTQVMEITIYNN